MQTVLIYGAAVLSLLNLLHFARQIWSGSVPATNMASWLMWVVMDIVLLSSTIASGEPYWLPLSYTLGASAVFLAHLKSGSWKWTNAESFCALGATLSTILWQTLSPEAGIVAGVIAMTTAGIPLLIDMWRSPNPGTFPMFFITAVACALTLAGTWPWTVGGSLLAFGGLVYNSLIAGLVLRKVEVEI